MKGRSSFHIANSTGWYSLAALASKVFSNSQYVNPLFSDHNGNVKCKVDLDGLDRQSRGGKKSLKMLCICVSFAAWGGMCLSGTAEQRMIWIWEICCSCCCCCIFFQEMACLGLELWEHKLSYFYPTYIYILCVHSPWPERKWVSFGILYLTINQQFSSSSNKKEGTDDNLKR